MSDKSVILGSLALVVILVSVFAFSNQPVKQQTDSLDSPVTGSSRSPIVMVEYGDFQCPSCAAVHPTLKRLKQEYKDSLYFTFVHFPLKLIHKNAEAAALASEAAKAQGKFWEMHDLLFERQSEWKNLTDPKEKFLEYARLIELDKTKFTQDYDNKIGKDKIESDVKIGNEAGVRGTPTFVINGLAYSGVPSYEQLKLRFEQILAQNQPAP